MINGNVEKKVNRLYAKSNIDNTLGQWIKDKDYFNYSLESNATDFQFSISYSREFGLERDSFAYTDYHYDWKRVVNNMSAKEYFKSIAEENPHVSMKEEVVGGMPVVHGSRIPVSLIVSCLSDGMSIEDICEDYGLKASDVKNSLEFVVELLDRPFHED